jgi:SAM-dependent methyltransferase
VDQTVSDTRARGGRLSRWADALYKSAAAENARAIESLLEPARGEVSLIDLGCDDGSLTVRLAERVRAAAVHGVEIVEDRARIAEERGVSVTRADLNAPLPLDDATFDVVCSNQVIEHLRDTDLFVGEIHRILRPGGYAVVSTENLASWHNIASLVLGWPVSLTNVSHVSGGIGNPFALHRGEAFEWKSWEHVRVFAYRGLADLFRAHGFEVDASEGAGYFTLLRGRLPRDDADKGGVADVEPRDPPRDAGRQRVISRPEKLLDVEPVPREKVGKPNRGQDARVEPRRLELVSRRLCQRKGVPDRAPHRDVRQRERHEPGHECCDVVPAREVLGTHDSRPARPEHAVDFTQEVVQRDDMLNHLVRVDEIEGRVRERKRRVEVAGDRLDSSGLRLLPGIIDDLYAGDAASCRCRLRESRCERTVIAAEVEEVVRPGASPGQADEVAVLLVRFEPEAQEISSQRSAEPPAKGGSTPCDTRSRRHARIVA